MTNERRTSQQSNQYSYVECTCLRWMAKDCDWRVFAVTTTISSQRDRKSGSGNSTISEKIGLSKLDAFCWTDYTIDWLILNSSLYVCIILLLISCYVFIFTFTFSKIVLSFTLLGAVLVCPSIQNSHLCRVGCVLSLLGHHHLTLFCLSIMNYPACILL